jgi:phosphatidylglycerol:prolipoprotein diacylglycerol transferase
MARVLLAWQGRIVHAYPAFLYAGMVAGTIAATRAAAADGLPAARVYAATLVLLLPALAGARLLFVFANARTYAREPRRIWRGSEGGYALFGGLLLALPVSVPVLRALGLGFWAFWDLATITMLVGMVLARIGCHLNGCCAGRETNGPLGFASPNHLGVVRRRVPTQALEGAVALALLAAVLAWRTSRPFEGAVFLAALAAYGTARALLEGLREEASRRQRALALGLAAIAAATWFARVS